MASALSVTRGARVALSVPRATPATERASEPDSWQIRAEGVSGLEGQARPCCAFVAGKRNAEPTLSLGALVFVRLLSQPRLLDVRLQDPVEPHQRRLPPPAHGPHVDPEQPGDLGLCPPVVEDEAHHL